MLEKTRSRDFYANMNWQKKKVASSAIMSSGIFSLLSVLSTCFDPAAEWLVVGWGGRSFYLETPTWSDLKPLPVLRALTADSSAMHVAVAGAINQNADGVLAIDLSEAEFAAMLSVMLEGFAKDASGEPILIAGRSYGPFDRFYEGVGAFNAVVGCNTWTSAVLRRAGLRTGFWNPLPQSLVWSLRAFNELP